NTINWLSSDEDLISIRPKEKEDRHITMTRSQLGWVRATSQFLLPFAVVLAGISVWWERRERICQGLLGNHYEIARAYRWSCRPFCSRRRFLLVGASQTHGRKCCATRRCSRDPEVGRIRNHENRNQEKGNCSACPCEK